LVSLFLAQHEALITTSALLAALLLTCLTVGSLRAQGRHELMIGTQVPIQFTAGYQYNASDRFAIRGQFGLLTPPYNKVILRSMEAFGFDKKLSRAVDEAFRQGLVGTLAPQLRFGSHSVVLQGQYVSLNGSITLQRAAALYLDRELPDLSAFPSCPSRPYAQHPFQPVSCWPGVRVANLPRLTAVSVQLGSRVFPKAWVANKFSPTSASSTYAWARACTADGQPLQDSYRLRLRAQPGVYLVYA
jgi:hypothetical protein